MTTDPERLAVLETAHAAHMKSDDERYNRIDTSLVQIVTQISDIGRKLDASISRAHDRIEEEAGKARHNLNNALQEVQIDGRSVNEEIKRIDDKVNDQKVWILTTAISALLAILAAGWQWINSRPPA